MDVSKKGAVSELIASAYFLNQGYEVFRNVAASGAADLVIWSHETGEITFVDVKTATKYIKQDGTVNYNYSRGVHTDKDIKYLLVHEGEIVGFTGDLP